MNVKTKEFTRQNINSKWLEGLVLLIILSLVILFSVYSKAKYTTIVDEKVSAWSGSIDNLD